MNIQIHPICVFMLVAALLLSAGCTGGNNAHDVSRGGDQDHETDAGAEPSNRVSISSSVRSNLGISFVTVERRRIEQTLRVPGQFEYLPTARREYRTMLPGRVELLVEQFDVVEHGAPLYRIDSPGWREMQQQLSKTLLSIDRLGAKLGTFDALFEAHERHEQSLKASEVIWQERVQQLESIRDAGGGKVTELAQTRASLASVQSDLAETFEKDAQLTASRIETSAQLDATKVEYELLVKAAAALLELDVDEFVEQVESTETHLERWQTIDTIEVRAAESGIVESLGLTNGSWADEKSAVMTIVRPDRLRFHASGLQSDLGVLRDGLESRIVPPTPTTSGRAVPLQDTMTGKLSLGLQGDADDRTLDLYVVPQELSSWARPGISAQLEIVTDVSVSAELAIPLAAVQRDGLMPIVFRRDPDNPDEAIRLEADLGSNDGRWVAVLSGVRDGDEVVLDGAFQLMLATSGAIQKGGHFHADGTFHEGGH